MFRRRAGMHVSLFMCSVPAPCFRLRPSRRVLDMETRNAAVECSSVLVVDVSPGATPRSPLLLFGDKSMSSDKVSTAFGIGGSAWGSCQPVCVRVRAEL